MENDGFKLVCNKKRLKKKICKKSVISYELEIESDFLLSVKKLHDLQLQLSESNEIHLLLTKLKTTVPLKNSEGLVKKFSSIICYGLGNLSKSYISRFQFSFLLLLKKYLQTDVFVYDPIFSLTDKKLLEYFDINLITKDEQGKRTVEEKTLFFMPHCPLFLYNNLLWANWNKNKLNNVIIIGNSLRNIIQDHISSKFNAKYKYICMTEKIIIENEIPIIDDEFPLMFEAFNEICLTKFSFCDDEHFSDKFWNEVSEPVYSDNEYI